MSRLSDIIAQLESGGGANVAAQPASMVNPTYGQYSGFVSQYGSGAAGVDNFGNQVLAANPSATLGDLYSKYVLGTGNPASSTNVSDLANQQPSAFANLSGNAGVPYSTPLADLLPGSSGGGGISVTSPDMPAPSSVGNDPLSGFFGGNQDFSGTANFTPNSIFTPIVTTSENGGSFNPQGDIFGIGGAIGDALPGLGFGGTANSASGNEAGVPQTNQSPAGFWATLQGDIVNWFTRGGLIILGIVVVAIGGYAVVKGENLGKYAETGLRRITR